MLSFSPEVVIGRQLTWRQRIWSPLVTLVFWGRFARAQSLRQAARLFTEDQQTIIIDLLKEHHLLSVKYFGKLNEVRHFDFEPLFRPRRVRDFITAFNQQIEGFAIVTTGNKSYIFSHTAKQLPSPPPPSPIPPPPIEHRPIDPAAKIVKVIETAGIPLTAKEIWAALSSEGVSAPTAMVALGKMEGRGAVLVCYAEDPDDRRFLLSAQLPNLLGTAIFEFAGEEQEPSYVFQAEVESLTRQGKIFQLRRADGATSYLSTNKLATLKPELITCKTNDGVCWCYQTELSTFLEHGQILIGFEKEGADFNQCYLWAADERSFAKELFNGLARKYLQFHPGSEAENTTSYHFLRCAFEAGYRNSQSTSPAEFLYEARTLLDLNADLQAIELSLLKTHRAVVSYGDRLQKMSLLSLTELREKIRGLQIARRTLAFVAQLPLLVVLGFSHSLQNLHYFYYDQIGSLPIFQALLVAKLAEVRAVARNNRPLSPLKYWQIELIFAPLAESKGYIELANNLRDLTARCFHSERYQETKRMMEAKLGLSLPEAKRHLTSVANNLQASLATVLPEIALRFVSRVKTVASVIGKEGAIGEAKDLLGIRFVVKDLATARQVAAQLQATAGINTCKDYLEQPNANGWRGWSSYLSEPETDRTYSVQVLTEEMLIADRMGKAAHWSYKATRAATAYALSCGFKAPLQRFDAEPLHKYSGGPANEFQVDLAAARKRNLVLVMNNLDKASLEQALNGLRDDREIAVLPIDQDTRVEDLAAFRGFADFPLYSHTELYAPTWDDARGVIVTKPALRGQSRVAIGTKPDNGQLLVLHYRGGLTYENLNKLKGLSNKFRTKLMLNLLLAAASGRIEEYDRAVTTNNQTAVRAMFEEKLAELAEQGKQTSAYQLIRQNLARNMPVIQRLCRVKRDAEVAAAIALGLLTEERINDALAVFKTELTMKIHEGKIQITIKTPDRRGCLVSMLDHFKDDYIILAAEFHTKVDKGYSPAEAVFTLEPLKANSSVRNFTGLQAELDSPITPKKSGDYTHQFQVGLQAGSDWSRLEDLIVWGSTHDLYVTHLSLPPIGSKASTGQIIFEYSENKPLQANALEELGQSLGDTFPKLKAVIGEL
jgi:hypothetical protein